MDAGLTSTPTSLPSMYLNQCMGEPPRLRSIIYGLGSPSTKLDLETSGNCQTALQIREDTFCNPSNVTSCSIYLNQELTMLGFSPILRGDCQELDSVRIVNCVYDLLHQHHHHVRTREDLETSLHRAQSDASLLKEARARLETEVHDSHKEVAGVREKERQAVQKLKVLSSKLRVEQDEMRRLKLSIQHKETQFNHESRKKEREYTRLKERLGQLVSDKSQERKLGMDILNALQRTDGRRARWRTQPAPAMHDEELYRVIIANYEERQKELIAENSCLRESLSNMQKELVSLLNEKSLLGQSFDKNVSLSLEEESSQGLTHDELLSSGHFQMPYELVRDGIERSIHTKWEKVKEQFSLLRTKVTSENEQKCEIEKLEARIAEYEALMDNNAAHVETKAKGRSKGLSDSWIADQNDLLDLRKQYFTDRDHHFKERERDYMDAIRRLDRDRQDFEQKKMDFFKEQFLDTSIFSTSFLDTPSQERSGSPRGKPPPSQPSGLHSTARQPTASPDLKFSENRPSPGRRHVLVAGGAHSSTPVLKRRLAAAEVPAVSSPRRDARDRLAPPVDYLNLEYPIVLSPEKQLGKVLNECGSDSLELESRKLKSIAEHSTEVRKALQRHKEDFNSSR